MKECKILMFSLSNRDIQNREHLKGYTGNGEVYAFPAIEKFLETYLNSGYSVKNMTGYGNAYAFYLERDV